MSWSIRELAGKPEKIRPEAEKDFAAAAKNYEGKTEEKDVIAARDMVFSFLDEAKVGDNEGVKIKAHGSRGAWSVSVTVDCQRIALLI